ncbi:MAG: HutD family protein [Lachnospiraceae bacterium]|nr:HutD family protein [Lachnospiraceae bacterium]
MALSIHSWDGEYVRILLESGEFFEGEAELLPAEYCLHELGREEAALEIRVQDDNALVDSWVFYEADIARIDRIEGPCPALPRLVYYLPEDEIQISRWSGGSTTEFLIYPGGAAYAKRDFLWRISSATVETVESDFTALPDYERFITPLEGGMRLSIDGGEGIDLKAMDILTFGGASATHSQGICTDFNLMLRKGRARGGMESISLSEAWERLNLPAEARHVLLYCPKGVCRIKTPCSEIVMQEKSPLLMVENPGDMGFEVCGTETAALVYAWAAETKEGETP